MKTYVAAYLAVAFAVSCIIGRLLREPETPQPAPIDNLAITPNPDTIDMITDIIGNLVASVEHLTTITETHTSLLDNHTEHLRVHNEHLQAHGDHLKAITPRQTP